MYEQVANELKIPNLTKVIINPDNNLVFFTMKGRARAYSADNLSKIVKDEQARTYHIQGEDGVTYRYACNTRVYDEVEEAVLRIQQEASKAKMPNVATVTMDANRMVSIRTKSGAVRTFSPYSVMNSNFLSRSRTLFIVDNDGSTFRFRFDEATGAQLEAIITSFQTGVEAAVVRQNVNNIISREDNKIAVIYDGGHAIINFEDALAAEFALVVSDGARPYELIDHLNRTEYHKAVIGVLYQLHFNKINISQASELITKYAREIADDDDDITVMVVDLRSYVGRRAPAPAMQQRPRTGTLASHEQTDNKDVEYGVDRLNIAWDLQVGGYQLTLLLDNGEEHHIPIYQHDSCKLTLFNKLIVESMQPGIGKRKYKIPFHHRGRVMAFSKGDSEGVRARLVDLDPRF